MKNNETQSDSIKEPTDANAAPLTRNPFLTPLFLGGFAIVTVLVGLFCYSITLNLLITLIVVSSLIIVDIIVIVFNTLK